MRRRSSGIGEVVSSVSMLAVTMAILGGATAIALTSFRSADSTLAAGSKDAVSDAGVLLSLAGSQSNSSGTYLWVFNYGWVAGRLTSIYLDGGVLAGWTSTCSPLRVESICSLRLPPGTHGALVMFFGQRTISVSL